MDNKQNQIELSNSRTDYAISIAKSLAGVVPFAGSLIAEIIGVTIPNQRTDRIVEFLKILDAKLITLGEDLDTLKEKMHNEEFVDLFEDGIFQVAKATSTERKEYIASFLKNSISKAQLNQIQKKKVLSIIGDLSDIEILILYYHSIEDLAESRRYYEEYKNIFYHSSPTMGTPDEKTEQMYIEKGIYELYEGHLVQLGLLELHYREPRNDEQLRFDQKTGKLQADHPSITALGKLLIKWLDLES